MATAKKKGKIEENIKILENLVHTIESENVPIDNLLEIYKKGAKIIAECKKDILNVEQQIMEYEN